ncbi:PhzF family phenazine biosynthesis protein [Herbidospora sp. RD11066]
MPNVDVIKVFCDQSGVCGNLLGVVTRGSEVAESDRQAVAKRLGYSETVFIDDLELGQVRIFSPANELPFAGHPLVGTAWLISRITGHMPHTLHPPAGAVPCWRVGDQVWIRGLLKDTPPWWHEQLSSPAYIDALEGPPARTQSATQLWAWENEGEGHVRARTYGSMFGIPEDEACGSASMRLAAALGRRLVIRHGNGSVIFAQPGPPGSAEVGGFVVREDTARNI